MSEFNFKSAICTSREQSEKLLALGLKKETADMCWIEEWGYDDDKQETFCTGNYFVRPIDYVWDDKYLDYIPAWSLDRLMELVPHRFGEYCDYANNFMYYYNIPFDVMEQFSGETRYEYLIDCIEWLIKVGYFNKEYLQ